MDTYKRHYTPAIVKTHTGPGTTHLIYHFENGYGASVIPEYDPTSFFVMIPERDLLELAVIYWDSQNEWHLLGWDDPILEHLAYGDNPIRRVTQAEVDTLLDQIAGL